MADGDQRGPVIRPDTGTTTEKAPLAQVFFDNIFLLLVLGLAVPIVFYTIWGLLEIASIPLAPPFELPR
ncbi:MAG TPA: hypothetical protein VHF87_20350 [Methylomirabilota bacterium]|jgi:hypothetical protein|nr:hypothetical protein [Methylomirabilota bacterium]